MSAKLKGHRLEQLRLLRDAGAISRGTAVAVAVGYNGYRPATLSRMFEEGLTDHAYMAFQGDSKRRLSHYWLTPAGLAATGEAA